MNTAARASSRRMSTDSNPGSNHRQMSQSRIPMGASRRNANTQPSYDFLAGPGGAGDSPPRQGRRMSISKPPPAGSRAQSRAESHAPGGEDLRAQVKTLQYEVDTLKQERTRTKLRHETEERDLRAKHEIALRNAQNTDSSKYIAIEKYHALQEELAASKENGSSRSGDVEKRLRTLQDQNRNLEEELHEVQAELDSQSRGTKRQLQEVETKHAKLVKTLEGLRADLETKNAALQSTQQKVDGKEADLGALEAENMRLRTQAGDIEEFEVIKREFNEQVSYNRKLEITNREQGTELRRLRDQAKTVGVIQEEKRVLEMQVERMDHLERELGEAKFQRTLLEDERSSWKSYLQNSMTDGEVEFDSPQAIAKALTSERVEHAALLDQLGRLQPELAAKEAEISILQAEVEKLKTQEPASGTLPSTSTEAKARARLERQRKLAQKEIEYLRAQLKTFETEDTTNIDLESAPAVDEVTKARIATLEDLVTEYRAEIEKLSKELRSPSTEPIAESKKRPSPSPENSERVSVLTRKLQSLQHTLSKAESQNRSLSSELTATKIQLTHLQSTSKTRILSLRENPTDTFTKEKTSTIAILRQENNDLHTQLSEAQSRSSTTQIKDLIPQSYLSASESQISALRAQLASSEKQLSRLRQIWSAKSLEFRTAVASLLGWRMDILPNGKFRLTSIFHPSLVDEGKEPDERIWDTSFIFDGDKGTMKIAGGSNSAFGQEVKGLVEYWVEGRKEIPGFLAACSMEWVERKADDG